MSISTLLIFSRLLFNIEELSRYTVLVSQPLCNYSQSNLCVIIYIWTKIIILIVLLSSLTDKSFVGIIGELINKFPIHFYTIYTIHK